MTLSELPLGNNPPAISFPHFPTRQQAFIWRNWELVPTQRLARVLGARPRDVLELALGMGLRVPPRVGREWLTRGYCTLIRNNWHLLPYGQLLKLLGWTADKLADILREDDFLWEKLGSHKPATEPIRYAPLTLEEARQTKDLRAVVARHFPAGRSSPHGEPPFHFLHDFKKSTRATRPVAPSGSFDLRLIYSYSAPCGDPLLDPKLDPYPEGLLARYAALGVNAVWLPAILYTLAPWDLFPKLSAGWPTRLANLRALVRRAARYGIGVYLYLNEPRCLPVAAFADHPELKGTEFPNLGVAILCTSLPPVQRFLRQASEHVFRQVPHLAGIFTITMNENPTNCYSRWLSAQNCPRCKARRPAEVIAEVNRLLAEGVRTGNPDARVLVWTWGWKPEWELEAVDRLPAGVELMCVSEWGLPTRVAGVNNSVVDYCISQVGPSDQSRRLWQRARARGLRTVAKVQVNNSWELSAVPWLPVPDLVERHLTNLRKAGVNGLMLSWTVGGFPGGNLALLDRSASDLAIERYGPWAAPLVHRAWRAFSRAFRTFPLNCGVLYHSPVNTGPANLLYPAPTGYSATMVQGFPYDDLKGWRNIYPEEKFERQFRKLSTGWHQGLALLTRALRLVPPAKRPQLEDLDRIARAAYGHYRSTYLQIRFVRLRDASSRAAARNRTLRAIIREEIKLAKMLHDIQRRDSRIGFEAANHYAYTPNDLKEKVIQCSWLRSRLDANRWS